MKFLRLLLPATGITIVFTLAADGQLPSRPQAQPPERIVVERKEVILDAVVRDKKGRPITNLGLNDFTVYEDGVKQTLTSCRLVGRTPAKDSTPADQKPGTQTSRPTAPAANNPQSANVAAAQPGAIALVFDRLSPEGRVRAHASALAYLKQGLGPDEYVAVFTIDQRLKVLQSFTRDPQLIKLAIDRAEQEGSATYTDSTKDIIGLSNQYQSLIAQDDQAKRAAADILIARGRSEEAQNVLNAAPERTFDLMAVEAAIMAAEGFEKLERDQQGYATTDALLAIINGMTALPRRKAMIFFSEGLAITTSTAANFKAVISNANRASVSVYPIDAAGLRLESPDVLAGQAMTALGQRRITQASHGGDSGLGAMNRDLERNEDLVRRNPASGLGQLADQTGGLFVSSTNDPGSRLRLVNEDLHSYYLLSYAPANKEYDGNFRETTVNVSRPGLEVQARGGYFALAESYDSPVLAYEAPALAALNRKSAANAFETYTRAFSFPEPLGNAVVTVLVEIPAGAINFRVDNGKTKYSSDFTVVALLRDQQGHVTRKLSAHYLLSGPYDKLDEALNGKVLFYQETQLAPGSYSVTAITYDALAKQSSISTAEFLVSTIEKTAPQLSSIVLIRTGERLTFFDEQASRFFRVNGVLLYPNLGEPVSKSDYRELPFFLTCYCGTKETAAAKLVVEIAREDRVVSQYSYDLPAPDSAGGIRFATTIPIEQLETGLFELRATVQSTNSKTSAVTRFTLGP